MGVYSPCMCFFCINALMDLMLIIAYRTIPVSSIDPRKGPI